MRNRKTAIIILTVGIGTFMSSLDSSIVNLALPLIKNSFGISLSMVEWIVTAYLLVVSSLLLTFGRLSDLYGHKKVYQTGFAIFTAGSLLCALSPNISVLIVFRIIQAIGAGMIFSTGPAIITNSVPPENRGKALSIRGGSCSGLMRRPRARRRAVNAFRLAEHILYQCPHRNLRPYNGN